MMIHSLGNVHRGEGERLNCGETKQNMMNVRRNVLIHKTKTVLGTCIFVECCAGLLTLSLL